MNNNRISTALVIGGGIFGVSTAAQLQRRGVAVTLINDGPLANGASGRSLSWLNSSRMRSNAYHLLRMAGINRYRSLSSKVGPIDWLAFHGGLTWDADDEGNEIAAAFQHELSIGYESEHLSATQVEAATPGVDTTAVTRQGAIFNAGEGWVDLASLIRHLADDFLAAGGKLATNHGAANVVLESGRAIGARTVDGTWFDGDAILIATGPAVPKMVGELGQRIEDATPVALLVSSKPLDHPLKAVLNTPRVAIRPAPGGSFCLDADWAADEVETRPDGTHHVKQSTIDALLAEASKVLEGNPKLEAASYSAGAKPIPGDGEPVVGALQGVPNCYVAFSHSGATLGLIVGELLAYEMATGKRHPMLSSFRPERFAV